MKHIILTLKICQEYLFSCSKLDAHSRNNNKFTEVLIYFVAFPLRRPNMNGTSDNQGWIQDCFPLGAVTWSQWPGGVWGGICALLKSLKNALFISNEIIGYSHIFSAPLPIFDAVARIIIDHLPFKRQKWVSKGDFPPPKLTKCIFETQFSRFGAYLYLLAKFC